MAVARISLLGTIRARLVALSVGALAVSLALFAIFAYAAFSYSLWQRHDAGLEATVDTIATAFATGVRVERGDEEEAAHHMLNELRFPSRKIGVYTLDGKPFPREGTKPDDPHHVHGPGVEIADVELAELARTHELDAATERVIFVTRETDDGAVRTAVEGFRSTAGNGYLIVAEEPNHGVAGTLALLRNALLVAVPFFLLLAFAAGCFLAERSLAPIAAMSERARSITATNLDARLPVANDRDELGELGLVFNELLDRLESAFTKLERAYSQMRQFIADASHELRTPLAAVRGEVQVTLKRPRDGEEYRASLGVIHEEAMHMSRIVEDLFTLARADADERQLERLPFYLCELVAECCRVLRPLATEHGVSLSVEPAAGEVEMEGDEGFIRRAILNLVDNALKYTEAGGSVRVIVRRNGELVHVDVVDTGIGIASAEQERIFDRFYRIDRARARSGGGAGLGLSIVRWAVEAHGGKVAVRSVPGRGTTFSLLLPIAGASTLTQLPGSSVDGAAV